MNFRQRSAIFAIALAEQNGTPVPKINKATENRLIELGYIKQIHSMRTKTGFTLRLTDKGKAFMSDYVFNE